MSSKQLGLSVQRSQKCACLTGIADCTVNACNCSVLRSDNRDFHLHSFNDNNCITGLDGITDLLLDLEDLACCTCFNADAACTG